MKNKLDYINSIKKFAKVKKHDFNKVDEIMTDFEILRGQIETTSSYTNQIIELLGSAEDQNEAAAQTFIDIANKLKDFQAIGDDLGFDFREFLGDDFRNNFDRYGDIIDNNHKELGELLTTWYKLQNI